jgi:hypothetical protein
MDIRTLGLKSSYAFKETHVPSSLEGEKIRATLKDIVSPTIRDLESRQLINGFHYIVHSDVDIRISSSNWPQHLPAIKEVLENHSVPPDLNDWQMAPDNYGGEIGVQLCYNNLEFNSRLCLALVQLMSETDNPAIDRNLAKLCPHQWVHYLCNQFGYLNRDQIIFEMNDSFVWLYDLMPTGRDDPDVTESVKEIMRQFEDATRKLKERFLKE